MKYLLFSAVPPTVKYSGGLMLYQLCTGMEKGSLACFVAKDPGLSFKIPEELDWMPRFIRDEPTKFFRKLSFSFPNSLRDAVTYLSEEWRTKRIRSNIVKEAIFFGHKQKVDCVWAVLQGKTTIIAAEEIAKGLNVPLITQVWDDPGWCIRADKLDFGSSKKVLEAFGAAMRSSTICAAASSEMADLYVDLYGVRTVAFLGSLDKGLAVNPADTFKNDSELRIGFAGQLYARNEWESFVRAFESVGWQIDGRRIKVSLIGDLYHVSTPPGAPIDFLGHRSVEDTIKVLSETDLAYCPYWFSKDFERVARTSFPCKLTAYFASGRPVFYHGPEYAAPARFIEKWKAGICCYSLAPEDILTKVTDLIRNPALYKTLAVNGRRAFDECLTVDILKKNFSIFLNSPWEAR